MPKFLNIRPDTAANQTHVSNFSTELLRLRNNDPKALFRESLTRNYTEYLHISSENAIILGDVEIPDHDAEILSMVADMAQKHDIKLLILNGDLYDAGKFSTWKKTVESSGISFSAEIEEVRDILRNFMKIFNNIALLSGNHEQRIPKMSGGSITLGHFLEGIHELRNVTFSEYGYLTLDSCGEQYYICHPQNYSRIPLSTARELAAKKLMNIIVGHNHHLSHGFDRSGRFHIIDGGCGRDPQKTQYKAMSANTFPEWIPGFVMILNGVPFTISKKNYPIFMS